MTVGVIQDAFVRGAEEEESLELGGACRPLVVCYAGVNFSPAHGDCSIGRL